jgi:O-antigen/teichoic acid export membrane protein
MAAMIAFAVGLIVLAAAVPLLILWARRRQRDSGDYVVRLVRNSAIPFAIQIVVRASDFACVAVLFRAFATDQAALTDFFFAAPITTLILATIAEWGLNIYLTREVARDPAAIDRTWGTGLVLRFAMALLVVPASLLIVVIFNALAGAGVIPDGIDARGGWLMLILALTVLPGAWSAAVTALFLATERPIVPAIVNLFTNIVSALLKIGAIVLGLGIIGVAAGALLAAIISAAMFAALLARSFGWPPLRYDRALARTMLRAGLPLMLNALLLAVFFRFDVTIIRAFRADELAPYEAAYKWVALTQILPPILINAVFPLFSRQAATDREGLRRAYDYLTRVLLLLALPIAAGVAILAPWAIALLGGWEYVALGAPALTMLIWYLPLSYVNGVTQYVLIALDRARTITLTFGLAAAFNFGFNVFFVPRFGINAAAVATVLSEIVLYLPFWWVLHREIAPTPLWQAAWRPALATLGMAAAMLLLRSIHPVLSLLGGPPVFAGLLLALGAIRDEDRRLLQRALRRA